MLLEGSTIDSPLKAATPPETLAATVPVIVAPADVLAGCWPKTTLDAGAAATMTVVVPWIDEFDVSVA